MVRTDFDGLYLELSCHLWDCLPGCRRANILTWKLTKAVAKLQHAAPLLWVHHTPRAGVVSLLVHKHCVHILLQQRSCKARTYYALSATLHRQSQKDSPTRQLSNRHELQQSCYKNALCSQDITLMCYRSSLQFHTMMRLQLLLRCF